MRQAVHEYIRASQKLLELNDVSDEEHQTITELQEQLNNLFPDEDDDAAD